MNLSVTFKARVNGNIPANRLCVLDGRDEDGMIFITIADRASAADFVSTRNLEDGEETEVTLYDGLRIWEVETEIDILAGQWVSAGSDGRLVHRTSNTMENVGIVLEHTPAGEIAQVVRRESFNNSWGVEIQEALETLQNQMQALEGEVSE